MAANTEIAHQTSRCLVQEDPAATFDFGPMAEQYDAWYETPQGRMYDRLEQEAVCRLLPEQSADRMRLLDVGCGTGHWSRLFVSLGYEVTGVDCSYEMIRVARAKGLPDARFEVANASDLPFEDDLFDVAVAVTSLEFCARSERMLHEMVRCVRPGGSIIVAGLNGQAPINRSRQEKPPYSHARWLSPEKLHCLLSPFGRPEIIAAAFVPRHPLLLWLAPVWERIAHGLHLTHGSLVVGKVAR